MPEVAIGFLSIVIPIGALAIIGMLWLQRQSPLFDGDDNDPRVSHAAGALAFGGVFALWLGISTVFGFNWLAPFDAIVRIAAPIFSPIGSLAFSIAVGLVGGLTLMWILVSYKSYRPDVDRSNGKNLRLVLFLTVLVLLITLFRFFIHYPYYNLLPH